MIRAVIFDFDLTLVDSFKAGNQTLKDMMQHHGVSSEGMSQKEMWGMTNQQFITRIYDINKGRFSKEQIEKLNKKYSIKNYMKLKIRDLDFISELKKKGIKIAVLSNNYKTIINSVLHSSQNSSLKFDAVAQSKGPTKKQAIIRISKKFSLTPGEVVYVGDHIKDIIAAKQAGAVSAAMPTGVHSEKDLRKMNPDMLIRKISCLSGQISLL